MNTLKTRHIGRNITRIRELCGLKQEAVAIAMGVSQQAISIMENSEEVEKKKLEEVANALGVTAKGIKKFSEEDVLAYISNSYDKNADVDTVASMNRILNFNTLDRLTDSYEENKKLYERLVLCEKEKIGYLEKVLNEYAFGKF